MLQVLGLNPAYVIAGAAALGLLLVIFVSVLAGPGVILEGAFGLLSQSMATATATLGTLVASSGLVIAQGMTIPATIVSQGGMIIANAIAGAASAMNTVFSIAAAAIASSAQIVASIVASAGQIIAGGAAMVANIVTSGAAAITSIYFAVQSAIIQLGVTLVQGAIMALGAYYGFIATAAAQIFGSLFSGLAAILGQLLSIPMIAFFGYVSVGTTIAGLVPQISIAIFSVFTSLFEKLTNFFTDATDPLGFPSMITGGGSGSGGPIGIQGSITAGFESLIVEFPNILKDAFFTPSL